MYKLKLIYFYLFLNYIEGKVINFIVEINNNLNKEFFPLSQEEEILIKSIIKNSYIIKDIRDNIHVKKNNDSLFMLLLNLLLIKEKYFLYVPLNLVIYFICSNLVSDIENLFLKFFYFTITYFFISSLIVKLMIIFYKIPNNYKLNSTITVVESFFMENEEFTVVIYTPIASIIFHVIFYYIHEFYLQNKIYKEIKNNFKYYFDKDTDKFKIPTTYENYQCLAALGLNT